MMFDHGSFDPRPTVRNSVWAYLFGGGLYWLGFYGYNQASIQRLTATRSEGTARGSVSLLYGINIYASIINIQVPHEVKYRRAIAKRTSQITKYGQNVIIQNGKMYIIQNGEWY